MKKVNTAKRQVVAPSNLENYLKNLLTTENSSYGIIIGQPSKTGPDSVVHLVRTPIDLNDIANSDESETKTKSQRHQTNIINEQFIEHALNTHRSLPGSFFIIGMFVVDQKFDLANKIAITGYQNALKELCQKLNSELHFGDCSELDDNRKLLFAYTNPGKYNCFSFGINQQSTTNLEMTPVEWSFNNTNSTDWYQVETFFNLTDFPSLFLSFNGGDKNIEKSCDNAIRNISKLVNDGVFILVDNAPIDIEKSMEVYIKSKQNKKTNSTQVLKGLWYMKKPEEEDNIKIMRYSPGTIQFNGSICCKVWLNSNQLSNNIRYFTMIDFLRSLAGRLHFYLDATLATEKNFNNLDKTTIALPRRVFYELENYSEIWFCDYLFPNEESDVVVETVKNTMDFDLDSSKIYFDYEVSSDENDTIKSYNQNEDILIVNNSAKQSFPLNYQIIAIVTFLILLVAILFQIFHSN